MIESLRPRIFADRERIRVLRNLKSDGHYGMLLERLISKCDNLIQNKPIPEHYVISEDDEADGWQRQLGDHMMDFTVLYAISEDRKYFDAAVKWAVTSSGYPSWGRGHFEDCDIVAAHQLLGISMVYDWLYDQLSAQVRQLLRETILKKAARMYQATQRSDTFWCREWLQNHMWINLTALYGAAVAVYEDAPEAELWMRTADEKMAMTMNLLGDDGASHEGYIYWEYGLSWLLRYLFLARKYSGRDYYNIEWFKNTLKYGIYMLLPQKGWDKENWFVDIADCDRINFPGSAGGMTFLLEHLSHEYQDGFAKYTAMQCDGHPACNTSFECLLYYNEKTVPKSTQLLPTQGYFPDMGLVSLRSDWSGDASLVAFRCGPYLGHKAFDAYNEAPFFDWGGGHVHPDVNHFVLFGVGKWLIRDDGYSHKQTSNHNTLVVGGYGQAGEGWIWFDGRPCHQTGGKPQILHTDFQAEYDYTVCAGEYAYPRWSGLTKFHRHFLFIKPDVLVVIDDITTDTITCMETRFTPEGQDIKKEGEAYVVRHDDALLRIAHWGSQFGPAERTVYRGRQTIQYNTREPSGKATVFLSKTRADRLYTATAFSWSKVTPQIVEATVEGDRILITLENKSYEVNKEFFSITVKDGR